MKKGIFVIILFTMLFCVPFTAYAKKDTHDLNVSVEVSGEGGSKSVYFRIEVNLRNLPADTRFEVISENINYYDFNSNLPIYEKFITLANGQVVSNASSIISDEYGFVSQIFYLKHGDTLTIHNLPADAEYKLNALTVDRGYYEAQCTLNGKQIITQWEKIGSQDNNYVFHCSRMLVMTGIEPTLVLSIGIILFLVGGIICLVIRCQKKEEKEEQEENTEDILREIDI